MDVYYTLALLNVKGAPSWKKPWQRGQAPADVCRVHAQWAGRPLPPRLTCEHFLPVWPPRSAFPATSLTACVYQARSGRIASPGALLSGINILVPEIISLEGIKDALKYIRILLAFSFGVVSPPQNVAAFPPPRPAPEHRPRRGWGYPPAPTPAPHFRSPTRAVAFCFHFFRLGATWLMVNFFSHVGGGERNMDVFIL